MSPSTNPSGSTFTDGTIDFTYNGETFQTYYKIYGDVSDLSKRPLLCLHGGPGIVHNYLICHSELTIKHGIPVILYDQIGNGKSTHLKEKAPEFWTIDLFVAELINLIKHFGIQDNFDLLGHSWGGMLGPEFAIRTQMPGLKHLIITDATPSTELWNQSNARLLQAFPDDVKEGVAGGMKEPEKYRMALEKFHSAHGCTVESPEEFTYTMAQVFGPDADTTVSSAPILKGWSVIDRLRDIRVPTLLINGRKDMAQEFAVKPFFDNIPMVKWVVLENSSHTPMFEEPARYMELVADFIM